MHFSHYGDDEDRERRKIQDGMTFTDTRQAVGIAPAEGDKGGVTLITKKAGNAQRPSAATSTTINGSKSNRK